MSSFEVPEPILNSPFESPKEHWWIMEGQIPERRQGRRPAMYYYREPGRDSTGKGGYHIELKRVNLIRERLDAWRAQGWPGVTRTTRDLLLHWRSEEREKRLFFAQIEAAETVVFLTEARVDFRQGIEVPRDEPTDEEKAQGYAGFLRYACKMATGSGKTTVMGMLAAWTILNKAQNRSDARFTARERGGSRANPKPEAILKWSHTPIAMLGGLWEKTLLEWQESTDEKRPPVFILVCKNTALANVIYDWLANGTCPVGIPPSKLDGFRNTPEKNHSILVHSKVVDETDDGNSKGDENRWMRFTLDTVGKLDWPRDAMGREVFPEGFQELAAKLKRPLNPPGRDVRCIVSVAMLTEGWDCNTVTHVVGLRPF